MNMIFYIVFSSISGQFLKYMVGRAVSEECQPFVETPCGIVPPGPNKQSFTARSK